MHYLYLQVLDYESLPNLTGAQKVLHQSSVEAIKCQFNWGVDQVKHQLSSTSEEMVWVLESDGSGASATLSMLQLCFVFDNCMHGAVSTSMFNLINSIERMLLILKGGVRDHK